MPANPIDVKPANLVATLVSFEYGNPDSPTIRRYAAWTSNITYEGNVFSALPGLSVEYGNQDGSLSDKPATIEMAIMDPVDKMRGTFPPTTVIIRELRPGTDATARVMWGGKVGRATFNHNGNVNTAKLTIIGHKHSLNTGLSYRLGLFCQNIFGQGACGFDLAAHTEEGTITAIVGQKVTVPGVPSAGVPNWFRFGEMFVDGFPISIHEHAAGSNDYYLVKPPPAYWMGQLARLRPGCDLTVPSCRFRNQEQFYSQLGLRLPNREVRINP